MKTFLLSLLFFVYGISSSYAQYLYGLDPTFAANGIYQGDTGAVIKMAVQQDGKVIITDGERKLGKPTAAMRFNGDGSIDNSFGVNGRFFSPLVDWYGYPRISNIVLQPDGKIVLGGIIDTGITSDDFFLLRLLPNGSLDHSFGGGGYVITGYTNIFGSGATEAISSLALQPDGKILAYGSFDFTQDTLQIVRYYTDGRVDSSFGVNGRVKLYQGFTYPTPNDVAVMSDGRIVVGAYTSIDALGGVTSVTVLRLLPDGSLDTSFNHTGVAYTRDNLPGLLYCKVMCLQPDGRVALGVYADSLSVVRFDTSGQLDNSFGLKGLVKLDPAGKMLDMLLQPDGKILLATNPDATPYYDTCYTIYRILPDGKLDTGFGKKGRLLTQTSNEATMLGTLALQPDGKIIAGGGYTPAGMKYPRIMLARYSPDAVTFTHSPNYNRNINVYPNPATAFIYINAPKQSIQQLSLYSLDGKLLLTKHFPYTDRLSTDGLANGIYYLRLNLSDHQQITKKVAIQNN